MPPQVSVIIAAYNVANYIEAAIASALGQAEVTVEVIVVDDCSSDKTSDFVESLSDPRVRLLKRATNGGPAISRNDGFAAASAPWIAVLDGDDQFLPGRLARLIQRAEKLKADVIVDNLLVFREEDQVSFPMFKPAWLEQLGVLNLATFISENRMLARGHTLGYCKPVFSSAFLKRAELKYDTNLQIGEDYMLLAEALAKNALCAIESIPGYRYTVRSGSISHRLSLEDIERITAGDKKLVSVYALAPDAAKAQRLREDSLKEVYAYTKLVAALKQCSIRDVLAAVRLYPKAVRHLWEPVWVRLRRLFA